MKKIFTIIATAIIMALTLTGCNIPEENLGELMGVTTKPTEAVTIAPETVPTEAPTETPATEPTAPFEAGQQVFCVYRHEGGMGLQRFFFVAMEGDTVIVTTAIPGSGEAGELLSFPAANCYDNSADAWDAAGMEPME